MPGITQDHCFDPVAIVFKDESDDEMTFVDERLAHFDECDAPNIYTSGFWRWFFATVRCECECHRLGLTEEEARSRRKQRYFTLAMLFMGTPWIPYFVALLLAD